MHKISYQTELGGLLGGLGDHVNRIACLFAERNNNKIYVEQVGLMLDYDEVYQFYMAKGPRFVRQSHDGGDRCRHCSSLFVVLGIGIGVKTRTLQSGNRVLRSARAFPNLFCLDASALEHVFTYLREPMQLHSAEEAAAVIAQRWFLRTQTSFPELLAKRLPPSTLQNYAEQLYKCKAEVMRVVDAAKSELEREAILEGDGDVPVKQPLQAREGSVIAALKSAIIETEREALQVAGGFPKRWPWMKRRDGTIGNGGEEGNDEEDDDDSIVSYLSYDHPFDPELGHRIDADNIDWYLYEKCRGGCYRQFRSKSHECGTCEAVFCGKCAKQSGGTVAECCGQWVCGNCRLCPCKGGGEGGGAEHGLGAWPGGGGPSGDESGQSF